MKKPFNYIFLISFLIFNCGKTDRVDTESVKEVLNSREIKKVTDLEITEAVLKKGKEDDQLFVDCLNKLKGNVFDYNQCAESKNHRSIDTVKIFISGSDFKDLKKMEKELVDAYQYGFSNDQTLHSNIQDMHDGLILYTSPFFIDKEGGKFLDREIKDEKPQSFGILLIYYSKKQLILEL